MRNRSSTRSGTSSISTTWRTSPDSFLGREAHPRAEREGFEPSEAISHLNSLAVSPIRPLSHLSSRTFAFRRAGLSIPGPESLRSIPCRAAYVNARRAFGRSECHSGESQRDRTFPRRGSCPGMRRQHATLGRSDQLLSSTRSRTTGRMCRSHGGVTPHRCRSGSGCHIPPPGGPPPRRGNRRRRSASAC